VLLFIASGCGSRTGFDVTAGPPPPPECTANQDCPGFDDLCAPVVCSDGKCQPSAPKDCDDHDACTADSCDSATGACLHPHLTLDLDGDGYYAPLPGKTFTDPDSCGTDCDDTNAAAHPGGTEVCDGVDNDCNGIVDDDATLIPTGSPLPISVGTDTASPEGLVGYNGGYMAAYSGTVGNHSSVDLALLSATGMRHGDPIQFTTIAADAYGGPLAWTGDRFGLVWSDRRDARGSQDNYEIYFNLVNPDGTKRIADVRVTNAPGFSINPAIAWTGNQFIVLWQDDGLTAGGMNQIFGQRIDIDGTLIGPNVRLDNNGPNQTPAIAVGQRSLGVVWMHGLPQNNHIFFAPFDQELHPLKAAVELTAPLTLGMRPTIVSNRNQYVIAWHDQDSPMNRTGYGTVKGELGEDVVPTKILINSPGQVRYPTLLPYGDRLLLVWSDFRNGTSYDLYANTVGPNLDPLQTEVRLSTSGGQNADPMLAFGPNGDAGILFWNVPVIGEPQTFFTRLACVVPLRP
jgi:hypothetical protein